MNWKSFFQEEENKQYFKVLMQFLDKEYKEKTVYPKRELLFNAFNKTSFENLKVVILGQDPYHEENQAMGLSFSVPSSVKIPPSLVNIFKEIKEDLEKKSCYKNGDLSLWAEQGVLLLNTTLSVVKHEANSHAKIGWSEFSQNAIRYISNNKKDVIFLLWGKFSVSKAKFIDEKKHCIFTSSHPSPLSSYRGFFGCKHFSKTNEILRNTNRKTIDW